MHRLPVPYICKMSSRALPGFECQRQTAPILRISERGCLQAVNQGWQYKGQQTATTEGDKMSNPNNSTMNTMKSGDTALIVTFSTKKAPSIRRIILNDESGGAWSYFEFSPDGLKQGLGRLCPNRYCCPDLSIIPDNDFVVEMLVEYHYFAAISQSLVLFNSGRRDFYEKAKAAIARLEECILQTQGANADHFRSIVEGWDAEKKAELDAHVENGRAIVEATNAVIAQGLVEKP